MVAADEATLAGGELEGPIAVLVDVDVLSRLERERVSMEEPDLRTTIRRRLESSGRRLAHFQRSDLLWPPPLRERRCVHSHVSAEGLAGLKAQADRLDIDQQTLLTGVLSDDLFASPLAIIDRDGPGSGFLRTERGRGRVYGMRFEVPGYQYAFMKIVGGDELQPTQVLELAIVCLAERIAKGDAPSGLRLTREAFTIASEISAGARRTGAFRR